jgi:excisionase family DNA binding protein
MTHKLAYNVGEAKAALGISRATLYRLIERGELRTFKIGTRTLITHEEMDGLLRRKTEPGHPGVAGSA